MTGVNEDSVRQEAKAVCRVVVVYEDAAARDRAVAFCDQLVGRFWNRFEFEVNWWSFAHLEAATSAHDSAGQAAQADLVIFAAAPEGDFPSSVPAWLETWIDQRADREGMLVGLMEAAESLGPLQSQKHHYLRHAAHRGAMDYLTQVPDEISRTIPDSLDSYSQRAGQVTSLLDDILHQPVPPPHPVP